MRLWFFAALAAPLLLSPLPTAAEETPMTTANAPAADPYLWLEEVDGDKALAWVREQNDKTFAALGADPRFESFKAEALGILTAKDRIPLGVRRGAYVYNFWQDEAHVRGLYRRTSAEGYRSAQPDWETVLDIDALAEAEGKNWVYQGATVLAPDYSRALLSLSDGGKDAGVLREFDLVQKRFVEGGFDFPERKQSAEWEDADTLLVASPLSEAEVTSSGYPRLVRRLKRGEALADAPILFEGEAEDVSIRPLVLRSGGRSLSLIVRSPSFFESDYYLPTDAGAKRLPLPRDADIAGLLGDDLIIFLRSDWRVGGVGLPQGSVASFSLAAFEKTGEIIKPQLLFAPGPRVSVQGVSVTASRVFLELLDTVKGEVRVFTREAGGWRGAPVALPDSGALHLVGLTPQEEGGFALYEGFLSPGALYELGADGGAAEIKTLPARFDAAGLAVRQFEAVSKDGEKIPYFHIAREAAEGPQPALIYGYGGFEVSMTPSYSGVMGKLWLEKGGAYVLANIRGGGEFGPAWHQAALKENRQRAYDDFIAVAEDLVKRGLSARRKMGVMGGSNGGLLVGATLTQRPDLYGAAIIQVPLLDMLRYHKLLAGASWIGEYGDPDIPADRTALERYSPYQHLSPQADYPLTFIYTSTRDDRVHPGHARKFAARMMEQGHGVLYFERIEGGHSAGANLAQAAERAALEYVYLHRQLME